MKYLSKVENNLIEFNSLLEFEKEKINANKEGLIDKEIALNKKIEENNNKIFNLEKKVSIYKKLIFLANKGDGSIGGCPVLDIHDDDFNYYCDVCPDEIFKSYQEVQDHYINEHKNILNIREKNYRKRNDIIVNNLNYEKFYFDTKLKYIKDELKFLLYEINRQRRKKIHSLYFIKFNILFF